MPVSTECATELLSLRYPSCRYHVDCEKANANVWSCRKNLKPFEAKHSLSYDKSKTYVKFWWLLIKLELQVNIQGNFYFID